MLEQILKEAIARKASTVHLSSGNHPAMRINGEIEKLKLPVLTNDAVTSILRACMEEEKFDEFEKTGDVDTAVKLEGLGRFRLNAFQQASGASAAFCVINSALPSMEELGLPSALRRILTMKEGLVLVTGPTGSGKSTTLAALIHEMNLTRQLNIITIEDPVEYIHTPCKSIISQREIGSNTKSYSAALKSSLREDPDVILVGEMRDLESIQAALTAAETGHLVLSTLHTVGAAKTIDRIIDVFPPAQQLQVRMQLSTVLRAVVSQRLLKKADGSGRVAAFEVLFNTTAVSNLIRDSKISQMNQVLQTGQNDGMKPFHKSLSELLTAGLITRDEALLYEPKQQ